MAEKAEKKNAAPAKAVTAVKKEEKKPGLFKRIGKWFREMRSELKKVIWPTPKQLLNNTLIALGLTIAAAIAVPTPGLPLEKLLPIRSSNRRSSGWNRISRAISPSSTVRRSR